MNALWLERFYTYRNSPLALLSAKALLEIKDMRRSHLLSRYHLVIPYNLYESCKTLEDVLLCEARNAKRFWASYAKLLPSWYADFSRKPRSGDTVNQLLDVGYHHLATMVEKIILAKGILPSVGLIHRPHRADSKPLVYDLMELFRADMVDFALLRYLRLKKKPIVNAQEHVGHFLSQINILREKPYYLQDFKQCQRYGYYMELQVVKFIKAVNQRDF